MNKKLFTLTVLRTEEPILPSDYNLSEEEASLPLYEPPSHCTETYLSRFPWMSSEAKHVWFECFNYPTADRSIGGRYEEFGANFLHNKKIWSWKRICCLYFRKFICMCPKIFVLKKEKTKKAKEESTLARHIPSPLALKMSDPTADFIRRKCFPRSRVEGRDTEKFNFLWLGCPFFR